MSERRLDNLIIENLDSISGGVLYELERLYKKGDIGTMPGCIREDNENYGIMKSLDFVDMSSEFVVFRDNYKYYYHKLNAKARKLYEELSKASS